MCHYGKKHFIGILQVLQENATVTKAWIINMKEEAEKGLVLISKCKGYFKTEPGNRAILVRLKPIEVNRKTFIYVKWCWICSFVILCGYWCFYLGHSTTIIFVAEMHSPL